MTPKHVVQVIDGMNIGGAEMLLRELSRGLLERNFRVSVCYNTPGPLIESFDEMKIPLRQFSPRRRVDPALLSWLTQVFRQERPAVVHTHLFKSDLHGRLAARLAGVPVVISTLHNNDIWARRFPLGRVYGWTAKAVDALIAVTADVKRYHVQYTGVPANQVHVIENGVDLSRFSAPPDDSAGVAIRNGFAIAAAAPLFGVIGRLVPQKDHALFLRTAAEILKSLPDARFLVVGDGELRQELEQQAKDLHLDQALIFAGIRKDIPAILAALDVLVFSSKWEGLPVTLLEAMAAEKPVVSTAVDGVRDVMQDGVTGLLCTPDAEALAAACVALARDPARRKAMGAAARKLATERYSIQSMIGRTVALYEKFMAAEKLAGDR